VNVISVWPCNFQCSCINLRLQVNYTAFWWWCITHRSTKFLDLYIDKCVKVQKRKASAETSSIFVLR
jgi:hypothetical protein